MPAMTSLFIIQTHRNDMQTLGHVSTLVCWISRGITYLHAISVHHVICIGVMSQSCQCFFFTGQNDAVDAKLETERDMNKILS